MTKNKTTETIIESLTGIIERGDVLSPQWWAEAAAQLAILRGKEDDMLAEYYVIAHKVIADLTDEMSATKADLKGKSTEEYRKYLRQKYKVDQINEIINAAKLRARISEQEYRQTE